MHASQWRITIERKLARIHTENIAIDHSIVSVLYHYVDFIHHISLVIYTCNYNIFKTKYFASLLFCSLLPISAFKQKWCVLLLDRVHFLLLHWVSRKKVLSKNSLQKLLVFYQTWNLISVVHCMNKTIASAFWNWI